MTTNNTTILSALLDIINTDDPEAQCKIIDQLQAPALAVTILWDGRVSGVVGISTTMPMEASATVSLLASAQQYLVAQMARAAQQAKEQASAAVPDGMD